MLKWLASPKSIMANDTTRGPLLAAVGACMRDAKEFAKVLHFVDVVIASKPNYTVSWQLAGCLREICRRRKDVLADVTNERVERWLDWLFGQLKSEPIVDKVQPIHARATEAIAYLLRRRRYDRSCLEVDGDLHVRGDRIIKHRISTVSGRHTDGMKHALAAMEMVRKYMRWSGSGDVVIGEDD
jgi:hypothetical protein